MAIKHTRLAELAKRHQLRQEIAVLLTKPLQAALPESERQWIADRARRGKTAQSRFPGHGGPKRDE